MGSPTGDSQRPVRLTWKTTGLDAVKDSCSLTSLHPEEPGAQGINSGIPIIHRMPPRQGSPLWGTQEPGHVAFC
jgi:hypothetical protein